MYCPECGEFDKEASKHDYICPACGGKGKSIPIKEPKIDIQKPKVGDVKSGSIKK